jgi:hypothetical protein
VPQGDIGNIPRGIYLRRVIFNQNTVIIGIWKFHGVK